MTGASLRSWIRVIMYDLLTDEERHFDAMLPNCESIARIKGQPKLLGAHKHTLTHTRTHTLTHSHTHIRAPGLCALSSVVSRAETARDESVENHERQSR